MDENKVIICLKIALKVKSESEITQSCPTPSDPMDCSLPGSSVHGMFQARVLEWGAIAFSHEMYKNTIKLRKSDWMIYTFEKLELNELSG